MSIFGAKRTHDAAAARLADVDSRFAAVMRSQAVIEFDLDGTVTFANDNFLKALGYRLDEIVGKHHSMFVDPAEASTSGYRDFWRQLNAGNFVAAKFRRIGKGGREVWIQASYNPVLDGHGRPVKVIKLATDITTSEQESLRNEAARKRGEEEQARVVAALGEALRALSQGDLTSRIEGVFEGGYAVMRDDYNAAVENLRHAMEVIAGVAHPLQQASQEISDAAQDLSRRTEQQAASLEETAAALDQITATVKSSAASVREASIVAEGAMGAARSSGEVVGEAVAAMSEIEQSSRKITEIIAVIDEIAFQTNLLALNAGVEAARAGDAGRGFAVVAQEVRALAQRSAEAAKEIKTLISSSRVQVEKGVALVGQTGQSLSGLMDRASQIASLIADIARSSDEQSGGLGEVNTAVNGMDKVTQQNAAMVEQTSAAAAQLGLRSTELATAVTRFHLGDAAPQHRPASRPPEPRRPAPGPAARAAPSSAREMQSRLKAVVGGGDSWEEF